MSLTALPTHVLILLLRKLDTEALYKLYESSNFFKKLMSEPAVVRACHFSLNRLATVESFDIPFFKDVAEHLNILNLSAVHDLDKSSLLPALKTMKNLTNLDITYTSITMPDYLEIANIAPKLKAIAINFSFGINYKIDNDLMSRYQDTFASLKNVHFVGRSTHLTDGTLGLCILQKADHINLKFTLCDNNTVVCKNLVYEDCDNIQMVKISHFQVYYIHEVFENPLQTSAVFKLLDLKKYEAVLLQSCYRSVFATRRLQEFIRDHFKVCVDDLDHAAGMVGRVIIIFWNVEQTQFDTEFYAKLLAFLQEHLVYKFEFIEAEPVPKYYKLYDVEQYPPDSDRGDFEERMGKRARLAGKTYSINYDAAFKDKKDNFKLKILFVSNARFVSLRYCNFLRKISHLALHGDVTLSSSFFRNLFQSCNSLLTLEIVRRRGIVATPLKFLSMCTSIKNIYLHVRGTHLEQIYSCLSKCRSLEIISLYNTTLDKEMEPLPSPEQLFRECDRMYHFSIRSFFVHENERLEQLDHYESVRDWLGKHWLRIDFVPYFDNVFQDLQNPYTNVFDAFRMEPPAF